MCGIFAYLYSRSSESQSDLSKIVQQAMLSQHRGPDNTVVQNNTKHTFVFHRLSINDPSPSGNQPLESNGNLLICNGEIYNHKELCAKYNFECLSGSDCEVILHMFSKFGIERTVQELDGVFAFVLYDSAADKYYVARDAIGVRSLYIGQTTNGDVLFASELKSIHNLVDHAELFPPGTYLQLYMSEPHLLQFEPWYHFSYPIERKSEDVLMTSCRELLSAAVKKRMMSDRPIGCFLSGGLDSSIVTALVVQNFEEPSNLHTFSIGMKGSTDLVYARKVADYLKTTHHEIIVSKEEMLGAIPEVVRLIESFDTTTVRASTPMYLLSKWIQKNSDIAVVFSGEGSDELSGSYMYFHNAPSPEAFQTETVRLIKDLHYFDVLRCDKSTASAGLEARVPFLDKAFVQQYMSVPPEIRMPRNKVEKYFLRKMFEDYLPHEIVWRTKEAFSDGVSSIEDSWFSTIQTFVENHCTDEQLELCKKVYSLPPQMKESAYYRMLFEKHYSNRGNTVPYYWLPKWSGDVVNPSARVLDVYT